MKILQIPAAGSYKKRISNQKWMFVSVFSQFLLLCFVVVKDWIWNNENLGKGILTSEFERFLIYIPVLVILQLHVFKFWKTYIFGFAFYLIWIAIQIFNLLVTNHFASEDFILLLLSILVLTIMIAVYFKNRILNNK